MSGQGSWRMDDHRYRGCPRSSRRRNALSRVPWPGPPPQGIQRRREAALRASCGPRGVFAQAPDFFGLQVAASRRVGLRIHRHDTDSLNSPGMRGVCVSCRPFSAGPPRRTGRKTGDAMLRADSRRHEASAAVAAIVAWAHQTSSSKADFVEASRLASMSSMGLFAPTGEVDMKSPPAPVRASRTDRRSDRSRP
jgi:hypothetical protein